MLRGGCSEEGAQRRVLTRGCSEEGAQRRVLTRGCSEEGAHRRVLRGECSEEGAQRRVLIGGCSEEGAHKRVQCSNVLLVRMASFRRVNELAGKTLHHFHAKPIISLQNCLTPELSCLTPDI